MRFTSSITAVFLSLTVVVQGATLASRAALDVFVPQIISPNTETVWVIGHIETVTWDASNAPANISNGASVVLDEVDTLVKGFDLRTGSVSLTVPLSVIPGEHRITLFGDSGNISPTFMIVASSE